jgi:transposase
LTAQSSEQSGKAIKIGCCSSVVQKQTKQPTHANLHQSKNKLLSSIYPFNNRSHQLPINVSQSPSTLLSSFHQMGVATSTVSEGATKSTAVASTQNQ